MEKMTMMDYIKETPAQAMKNIEDYATLCAPLVNYAKEKKMRRLWLVASGSKSLPLIHSLGMNMRLRMMMWLS